MSFRRAAARRWRALKKRIFHRLIDLWPPYLGSGIRVRRLDLAGGVVEVEMKLRWWNRNYVGTHYGGSLYSMCDPFYMLILLEQLGGRFVVWDKSASIRFRKPGRGTVRARFEIAKGEIDEIRTAAMRDGKAEPRFVAKVVDADGQVIAEVEKRVHVKYEKKRKR
ncbi:MAG TPA: DUF4442 domain-containing protein [Thermoanaerobaculia bacterium]|nr:DUF4442 domain-containing protein [Thermoanaerobaculia bacterium]